MRRTDREVTDVQKMKVILDRCKIVSYAMWDGEKPYAVIMNFGYEFTPEGKLRLYSHSALDGKKFPSSAASAIKWLRLWSAESASSLISKFLARAARLSKASWLTER